MEFSWNEHTFSGRSKEIYLGRKGKESLQMKKYTNHRLGWKGGILIALISTILLYTLATVYAEEEADVSVEWQPEVSEAKTGETVAIRLSSYINTETAESVEVKIALTEEEASMLGELPEGLALENAEGGGRTGGHRATGADTGEKGWNAAFYGVFWLDA